jgi:hypothetical protein
MKASYSKTFVFFGEALVNIILVLIAAFIVANLALWIKATVQKSKFQFQFFDRTILLLIVAFAFLGYTIGLLIGLSQSPVVHVAVPSLLTFYGGFLTYLFAKDSFKNEKAKTAIIISVMSVSFFLVYGVEVGSLEKSRALESAKKFEMYYFEKEEQIKKKYR